MAFGEPKKFELTEDHLKLVKQMNIGYDEWTETGAPEVDPKRPYGNSYVPGDVAEILGWEYDTDDDMPNEMHDRAMQLHRETETVLQIIVQHADVQPGLYKTSASYTRDWEPADESTR